MKNRLELAKRLLADDGVIFVQCDDNEQAYLKVLMDEVFGRENFINCLPRITKKAGKSTDSISKNNDYIIIFSKNDVNFNQSEIDENDYKFKDNHLEKRGSYKLNQTLDYDTLGYINSLDYEITINDTTYFPGGVSDIDFKKRKKLNPKNGFRWRWSKELFEFGMKNDFIVVKGNRIYTKTYTKAKISRTTPYCIEYFRRTKNITSLEFIENQYSNDNARKNIQSIFNENAFQYSKPETLIQRIIEISTNPNDLVLDFHLGSGTTAAVAHKMGRRYIGIEQMDYIEDIAVARLKKVIDGEQGGISKSVDWQGGGSFVYCELLENANPLISTIEQADENNIQDIKQKIYEDQKIIPYISSLELDKTSDDFNNLTLDEQKKALCLLVDKNKLYVNFSDIDDEDYQVNQRDKDFTNSFYAEK